MKRLKEIEKFYLPQNQMNLMVVLNECGLRASEIAKLEWRELRGGVFEEKRGLFKKKIKIDSSLLRRNLIKYKGKRYRHDNNSTGGISDGFDQFRYIFYKKLPTGSSYGQRYSTLEVRHILQNFLQFDKKAIDNKLVMS